MTIIVKLWQVQRNKIIKRIDLIEKESFLAMN